MLPAANRLTDSEAFRLTVRSGRRAATSRLVVHLLVDDRAEPRPVEVGFTVSKAVGNAVVRNRVKRRLRHLTREHLPSLEELPGRVTLVARALPASATAGSQQLSDDLGRNLDRVLSGRVSS